MAAGGWTEIHIFHWLYIYTSTFILIYGIMHYKTSPYERSGWREEMIFVKTCSYITFVDWLQNSGRNVIYVWGIKWIHVCSNRACEKIIHYCFNRACIQSSFAGILLINVTSNVARVSLFRCIWCTLRRRCNHPFEAQLKSVAFKSTFDIHKPQQNNNPH